MRITRQRLRKLIKESMLDFPIGFMNQLSQSFEVETMRSSDNYRAFKITKHFNDGWFVETMPDLNQNNKFMSTYLIQNAIWWIEYSGIKGYRVDTYPYADKNFMSDWTFEIMNEYPYFNIVGEEWSDTPIVTSYWQAGKVNHDGYVSYLPSLMDFPLQINFAEALNDEITWGISFCGLSKFPYGIYGLMILVFILYFLLKSFANWVSISLINP